MDKFYHVTSSGVKSSNTAIASTGGYLHGVLADTGSTVTVYDNASAASGTVLWEGTGVAQITFNNPVAANTGIYLAVSGGNAIVYYSLG